MFLSYKNKKSALDILKSSQIGHLSNFDRNKNNLIFGENFNVLQTLLNKYNLKNSIDLIYIDPPFATKQIFKIGNNRTSTISNSKNDQIAYNDLLIGDEFLEFIRERLILFREILSEQGSIYLHTDYKIGHYIKIIMDEVFGISNFRNDITRIKSNPKNFFRKAYGNQKDMVLFYTKGKNYIWNDSIEEYNSNINLFPKIDQNGRKYTTIPLHALGETNGATSMEWRGMKPPQGRHWRSEIKVLEELDNSGLIEWSSNGNPRKKIFFDERNGKKRQDIWEFKDPQKPIYPTEKNNKLLENIIKTSSNIDSIILDGFAGSGVTLKEANSLGRKWIGIDQSEEAIKVIKNQFNNLTLFEEPDYNYSIYKI
jgi:adenine-specific DNA-methyltransferase